MKDVKIIIRVNMTEKEAIIKKADKLNMNLSEYLRFIALNGVVK